MKIQTRPYFDIHAQDVPALVYHLFMTFHRAMEWGNDATHEISLEWLKQAAGRPDLDEDADENMEAVEDFRREFDARMARPDGNCCGDKAGCDAIKAMAVKPTLEDAIAMYEGILKEHNIDPATDVSVHLWW